MLITMATVVLIMKVRMTITVSCTIFRSAVLMTKVLLMIRLTMLVVVVEILVHVSLSHLVTHASASAAPADGVDFHTLAGRCISSNQRASGPNSHTHTPCRKAPLSFREFRY